MISIIISHWLPYDWLSVINSVFVLPPSPYHTSSHVVSTHTHTFLLFLYIYSNWLKAEFSIPAYHHSLGRHQWIFLCWRQRLAWAWSLCLVFIWGAAYLNIYLSRLVPWSMNSAKSWTCTKQSMTHINNIRRDKAWGEIVGQHICFAIHVLFTLRGEVLIKWIY